MYQVIAVAIMFVAMGSSANGHPAQPSDQGIDSILVMRRECLHTLGQLTAGLALMRQHLDSVRLSSCAEKKVGVVVLESKSLRKGIAPESKQLIAIPANTSVTLIDYRAEPLPSFQVTYGVHVGWLVLDENEINSEVSRFIARRTLAAVSDESDHSTVGVSLRFVEISYTALLGILTAVSINYITSRRRQKRDNIWSGLVQLMRIVREKYQDSGKQSMSLQPEYLNPDTEAYIYEIGLHDALLAYLGKRFDSITEAMSEYKVIVKRLERLLSSGKSIKKRTTIYPWRKL